MKNTLGKNKLKKEKNVLREDCARDEDESKKHNNQCPRLWQSLKTMIAITYFIFSHNEFNLAIFCLNYYLFVIIYCFYLSVNCSF